MISDVNVFRTRVIMTVLCESDGGLTVTEQYCGTVDRFEELADEATKPYGFLGSVSSGNVFGFRC